MRRVTQNLRKWFFKKRWRCLAFKSISKTYDIIDKYIINMKAGKMVAKNLKNIIFKIRKSNFLFGTESYILYK